MSNYPNPNQIDLTVLKGDTGNTGNTGNSGSDGDTYYPYTAFADDSSGTNWTLTSTGKTFVATVYSTEFYNPITEAQFNALTPQWVDFTEDISALWNQVAWEQPTGTMPTGWINGLYCRKIGDMIEFKGAIGTDGSNDAINAVNSTQPVFPAAQWYINTGLNMPTSMLPSSGLNFLINVTIIDTSGNNTINYENYAIGIVINSSGNISIRNKYGVLNGTGVITGFSFEGVSYYKS